MKRFLTILVVLVAAAFALSACCAFKKGPCGAGAPAAGMSKCDKCPQAPACECAKGGPCKCPDGCKCAHCAKKAATAGCACGKGADCKCVDCKCAHCTELKHGPVGAPEGAPAKK
jgi:hypothetical protein